MIYIPKVCGTCKGSSRAIDLAKSLKSKNKKIFIYKEILHNSEVINDLKKMDILCIDNLDEVNDGDIVVIRAHGEPKCTYDYLNSKGIEYYDATCLNVVKIHETITKKYNDGYSIIIVGKKNHPETIGSNGWCDNNAFIIEKEEDVDFVNDLNDNILVIAQTTISEELYDSVSTKIKNKFTSKNVEIVNSVCFAQKQIQLSSIEVAKKCKYTFVIGGKESSNTRELFNLCLSVCPNTYIFHDDASFLEFVKKNKSLSLDDDICVTGGASSPMYQIESYRNLLLFYLNYRSVKNDLEDKMNELNNSLKINDDNYIVKDAIDKFTYANCGGKYIRSFLIDLGYKLHGTINNYSYKLGLAYEMFETSILIHDDIIDNSNMRRNKDTIPVMYQKDFNKNSEEVANSLGICIGDYGFYCANKVIIDNYSGDKSFAKLLGYYNDVVINTIKGELIDVYLPFKEQYICNSNVKYEDIMEIYKMKTAWYTIVGPFCMGLILCNSSDNEIEMFKKALLPLGIAFQIKDDILGVFSDSEVIGKDTNDVSEYKQTLLYYYAINSEYKDELLKYYGKNNLSKEESDVVKDIFVKSNALYNTTKLMNELFDESQLIISNMDIDIDYKNILLGFITYLKFRSK